MTAAWPAPPSKICSPRISGAARIFSDRPIPHPVAYHLVQLDRGGSRYRVSLVSVYTGQPASYLATEEVKVERRVRRYLIAQVRRRGQAEAVLSGQDLLLNVGGKPQGRLTLQELPAEVVPVGGEAPLGAGRDRFGPVAHNPNNPREIALSANGLHALAATALFPAAGRNKAVVKPINLFFEGAVTQIIWLPGNALVAVEVLTPAGATAINLYDVTERRRPKRLIRTGKSVGGRRPTSACVISPAGRKPWSSRPPSPGERKRTGPGRWGRGKWSVGTKGLRQESSRRIQNKGYIWQPFPDQARPEYYTAETQRPQRRPRRQ